MPRCSKPPELSLSAAFDSAPYGVAVVDSNALILYVNKKTESILGSDAAELAGKDLARLLALHQKAEKPSPSDSELPIAQTLRTGENSGEVALTLSALDHKRRFIRISAVSWKTDNDIHGAIVYLVDETARHDADEGRRASEANLLEFVRNSPEPAVIHSNGEVIVANPVAAKALGYDSPEDLVGRHMIELTHPDDRVAVRERVSKMLRTRNPVPLREERFLRRDGSTFVAEVIALPVMLSGLVSILVWGRDLTQQRQADVERLQLLAEQTRLREEAQQRAAEVEGILDNMLTGLFVCDTAGRITLTNPLGAQMLGCRSELEVVGLTLSELVERFDLRHVDSTPLTVEEFALTRALAGETVALQDTGVEPMGTQGERFFRSSAGPIRNASGDVVAAAQVFRDITDVVEFNRLKDQFLRVVAHELKTPVAIMKGYTELLTRNPEAARRIDAVAAIQRGADRIDHIVTDMASLSGLLQGNMKLDLEPLQFDAVVLEVAHRIEQDLKRHRLALDVAPVRVVGDYARLEQVVFHLVDNAVRYSPKGGLVSIVVRHDDDKAIFTVTDQGVGIPEDKQRHIYKRFFRAHTDTPYDYGGLGIGLAMSKELVELHGGRMWFESQEGSGSTFALELPSESVR